MTLTFSTPPLVELIAELRWLPSGSSAIPNDPNNISVPASFFTTGVSDLLFMRFASLIGAQGFTQSERLMPQGIPTLPFQPIYRYSQAGTKPGATLFQLGAGVFSAHITPPYKRWSDFRPFLEKGVTALLEAREGSEKESLFTQSLVRYLDNFSEVHTQAASVRQFLAETLGIQIKLPEALESRVSKGKGITPFVKLTVPLDEGRTMSLSVGNGKIGDKAGIIMDSAVASMKPLQPKIDVVMQFLDDAHRVVSDCFVEITTPIHQAMGVTDE